MAPIKNFVCVPTRSNTSTQAMRQ